MARKKKFTLRALPVERYAAEGKCIAHDGEKVVFVEGAVPGDVADIFVHRNKKDWAEGRMERLISPSPHRTEPFCAHFGTCGGCKWQMLPYDKQILYKDQQVRDQLRRIGHVEPETVKPILGCSETRNYRNKLEFTFSNRRYLNTEEMRQGLPFEEEVLGFHAPGYFDKVIDIDTCHLQPEPSNRIKNWIRSYAREHALPFYDIRRHEGVLRNLMIRVATTGDVLVNVVFGEDRPEAIQPLMQALQQAFPEITSLHYTVNLKANDSLYDQDIRCFGGQDYITETLEDFRFKISPKSFFQTNTKQAEALYRVVREMAELQSGQTLYDLYCGTGSIGIFLSKQAGKVIGVETVEDAVKDARLNAEWNGLQNAEFFAGDVIDLCNDAFFAEHGQPDVVVIDPPRAGCHEKLLRKLLDIAAPRIVYVSCNPATQARDLQVLSEGYRVVQSQAVDMFPHTHHIENVVQLVRV
jgi:23S rRNA (uracil1939-C5)-methyltransferase